MPQFISAIVPVVLDKYQLRERERQVYFSKLLEYGVDFSKTEKRGQNALFSVVEMKDIESARVLVKAKVPVKPNEYAMNALDIALLTYHPKSSDMVEVILSSGIELDDTHRDIKIWIENQFGRDLPGFEQWM